MASTEFDSYLDERLGPAAEQLSRRARRAATLAGRAAKAIADGDLRTVESSLRDLQAVQLEEPTAAAVEAVGSFDYRAYLESGFAREFEAACRGAGLPLEGHFPSYFVFPIPIKIDTDNPSVLINRKRVGMLRPASLVSAIQAEKDRLERSPFNVQEFIGVLFSTWEKMNALQGVENQLRLRQPQPLKQVYRELVPFGRWRRDYPESFFAFDIQRLLLSDVNSHNGWTLVLERGRGSSALRLIDRNGAEKLIASVNFVESEG